MAKLITDSKWEKFGKLSFSMIDSGPLTNGLRFSCQRALRVPVFPYVVFFKDFIRDFSNGEKGIILSLVDQGIFAPEIFQDFENVPSSYLEGADTHIPIESPFLRERDKARLVIDGVGKDILPRFYSVWPSDTSRTLFGGEINYFDLGRTVKLTEFKPGGFAQVQQILLQQGKQPWDLVFCQPGQRRETIIKRIKFTKGWRLSRNILADWEGRSDGLSLTTTAAILGNLIRNHPNEMENIET